MRKSGCVTISFRFLDACLLGEAECSHGTSHLADAGKTIEELQFIRGEEAIGTPVASAIRCEEIRKAVVYWRSFSDDRKSVAAKGVPEALGI
jgi:hypothetical protein